jgi:hypothetical protein
MSARKDQAIDYEELNGRFNSARLRSVFDNAQGNASGSRNKTSIYLFLGRDGTDCVRRLANISTRDIDGIEEFGLDGLCLLRMLIAYTPEAYLRMNTIVYRQLLEWWWRQKECSEPEALSHFAGAAIVIDDEIRSDQETVI